MKSSRLKAKARAYMREHPDMNYTQALSAVSSSKNPLLGNTLSHMIEGILDIEEEDGAASIAVPLYEARAGDVVKVGNRHGLYLENGTILLDGEVLRVEELPDKIVEIYRLGASSSPEMDTSFLSVLGISDLDSYVPSRLWEANSTAPIRVVIGEEYGVFGVDIPKPTGTPHILDFADTPNITVIGNTGSGKSVLVDGIVMSLAAKYSPDRVKFLLLSGIPTAVSSLPHVVAECGEGSVEEFCSLLKKEVQNRKDDESLRDQKFIVVVGDNPSWFRKEQSYLEKTIVSTMSVGGELGVHVIAAGYSPRDFSQNILKRCSAVYRMGTPDQLAARMKVRGYPYGVALGNQRGFAVCTEPAKHGDALLSVQVLNSSFQNPEVDRLLNILSGTKQEKTWPESLGIPDFPNIRGGAKEMWKRSSPLDLSVPLGRYSNKEVARVDLSGRDTGAHLQISGPLGSGKTTAYTNVVMSLAAKQRPDRVRFVLLDASGDHREAMRPLSRLPHTEAYASGRAKVDVVLFQVGIEVKRRHEGLRREYREFSPCPDTPHLVVVLEMGEGGMNSLSKESLTALKLVCGLGRTLGVHLVVSSAQEEKWLDTLAGSGMSLHLLGHGHAGTGVLKDTELSGGKDIRVYDPNEDGLLTKLLEFMDGVEAEDTMFSVLLQNRGL